MVYTFFVCTISLTEVYFFLTEKRGNITPMRWNYHQRDIKVNVLHVPGVMTNLFDQQFQSEPLIPNDFYVMAMFIFPIVMYSWSFFFFTNSVV